jgi:GNAT superfamily N-acetyltransferase
LPAIFQVSTGSAPADLDARLAGRGYRLEHPSEVWTARTGDVHAHTAPACVPGLSFVPADAPDGAWLDCALLDDAPARRAGREGIVRRISRPRLVASIRADGLVVASGLGVSDGGWTGVFLMATRRNWRGRRLATAILHHLAAWAAGRGDAWMYLQVDTDNVAARHVYHRSGFAFAYPYHFRALRADGRPLIPSTVSGLGGDGAGGAPPTGAPVVIRRGRRRPGPRRSSAPWRCP